MWLEFLHGDEASSEGGRGSPAAFTSLPGAFCKPKKVTQPKSGSFRLNHKLSIFSEAHVAPKDLQAAMRPPFSDTTKATACSRSEAAFVK